MTTDHIKPKQPWHYSNVW